MKKIIFYLCLAAVTVSGADLTTKSAVVDHDIKMMRLHAKDGTTICYQEMPDDLKEKYSKDEEGLKKRLAEQRKKAREERAARQAKLKKERAEKAALQKKQTQNRKAKELLKEQLTALLQFKDTADFKTYGFGMGGKYHQWLEFTQKAKEVIQDNDDLDADIRAAAGHILQIGIDYAVHQGQDTNYILKVLPEVQTLLGMPVDPNAPKRLYDENPKKSIYDAWVFCQYLVESKLVSPKTAKFQFAGADKIKITTDGVYLINSYVDSQNLFGATVRTNFHCRLAVKNDKFIVLDLRFD